MNRKMVVVKILLAFVFFQIGTNLVGNENPLLIVEMERESAKKVFNQLKGEKKKLFREDFKKVRDSIKEIYSEMWSDFDSKGKSTLPWGIYEVFNRLKGLGNIYIYFSIKGDKIPSGDVVTNGRLGAGSYNAMNISLYGVYKEYYVGGMR